MVTQTVAPRMSIRSGLTRSALTTFLCLCCAETGVAQPDYGRSPAIPWQFRPVPATHAQGTLPNERGIPSAPRSGQWLPGQMFYPPPGYPPPGYPQPGYPQQWPSGYAPEPAQSQAPRLEWSFDESQPYFQQPVILRLELIGSGNLSTANLELPATDEALIASLGDPIAHSRIAAGQREIVTSYLLSVTPLRTGNLELPPIKIVGAQRADGLGRFESTTVRPLRLSVRPAMNSVQPWLALKSLRLSASIDPGGTLDPGQPATLALEIAAVGATANQLPSLESQLIGETLHIYREQTLTNSGLSPDGRDLIASRTEYYTLVPQAGGRLSLPEMRIPWWNVDRQLREVARLPIKTLDVRGLGPLELSAFRLAESRLGVYWLPLAGLLLLLAGYWGGVFYRERLRQSAAAAKRSLSLRLRAAMTDAQGRLRQQLARLHPAPFLARARLAWMRRQSPDSRLRACLRYANRAATPGEWLERFESAARVRLLQTAISNPAISNLPEIGKSVFMQTRIAHSPGAGSASPKRQLEAALYGQQALDFPRWKRDLLRQFTHRSEFFGHPASRRRNRWATLPALNPR